MKEKINERLGEKFYTKLKDELLSASYFSSNLIQKARAAKEGDKKYVDKVDAIQDYLLQKMKEGDGVAYALLYAAHEDKLSKIDELHSFDKISKYLSTHTDVQSISDNSFFDPKVVYFAEVLGGASETEI